MLSLGAGLRLLASLLFLIWTIPAATADRVAHDLAKSQIGATEPVTYPTVLARSIARHVGAETSRFKTPVIARDGKPFCIIAVLRLPPETASAAPFGIWTEDRPELSPIRAFDARAPPLLTA
ncbi:MULTISPECIES: hypothetical protein [unclassified Mesorhizobium]|uniref:hypothetical protein n=1 Tax=unclassified Mesorhizobium TaxID=325217 RepID=UPI000FE49194|nr:MULTISPECIES: hypothetical protein [unclassified Mesorhizobium]RWG41305.1 MAG: hypothetical protein EOQ62_28065 [Mesorhizobium sp.]RWI28865.1 MAG: hypothetical protein EOQ92_06465 [Mesorhizobium sp.]RWK53015.1 MAG: hypothetical protein EOR47_02835 [Mesorhizobium sp.]RWK97922.1 MAG: hypothetical protein EOR53_03715 [Mesorhizobium sp.]TIP61220.1 MAG: hypothetical protein E5X56_02305 [Mesorhizobium sp.]